VFSNASFYLLALLIVVVAGFWKSYFFVPPRDVLPSLRAHSILMLLWLGILIVQPWLIRTRRYGLHRAIGKASYAFFPLLLIAGTYVVFQDLGRNYEDPLSAKALGNFFSGFVFMAILRIHSAELREIPYDDSRHTR